MHDYNYSGENAPQPQEQANGNSHAKLVVLASIFVPVLVATAAFVGYTAATDRNVEEAAAVASSQQITNDGQREAGATSAPDANILSDEARHDRFEIDERSAKAPEAQQRSQQAQNEGRLLSKGEVGYEAQTLALIEQATRPTDAELANIPNNDWLTWDRLVPGMAVAVPAGPSAERCTMGFVGEQNGKFIGLTAGHCMDSSDGILKWKHRDRPDVEPLGNFTEGQTREYSLTSGFNGQTDYAVFDFDKGIDGDRRIANTYDVVDVLSADEIKPGMEICKFGHRTEETCGPVLASNDTFARANVFSLGGDSGGAAYVKLSDTEVAAVGILSSSPKFDDGEVVDYVSDFALLDPILQHSGIEVAYTK